MRKIYFISMVIACLFTLNTSIAQNKSEYIKAKKYLDRKGEVYFHFNVQSPADLLYLTNIISVDNVKNGEVWAYANKKEFVQFLAKNISYQVLPHPGDVIVEMWDSSKGIWQFDTYPTYTEYETMMQTFATNYPNICKLDTIGILPSGRKLLAIKITDNPDVDENEPEFLYSGTMHGDETTGYVLFLRLINYLTTNYGTDSRITSIVNNTEIWICPLANPDGTYFGGNSTVTGAIRLNGNYVDLNKNYPDPRTGQHPDGNAWQPETVAFMNFADNHDFVMGANTHGGAEVFNYPWDTWTSAQKTHADDNWWQYVGNEFADTAQFNGPAGYFTDVTASGITQGGDWYVITGGRQDYMNYFKYCREVTIEISATKMVAGSQLPDYWNYQYRSFLNYIEQSLYGVRGIITDACTNQPIKAKVFVNSHDVDSSHVFSSLPVGNYHRPILAGTYSITYSASGYQSQTVNNIVVSNMATVIQNIQLSPLAPVADFTADHTSGCNPNIQFTNTSQASVGSTFLWDFGDGQTSTSENPLHSYSSSGNYTVTLTVSNSCTGNDTLIITNYINITLPTAPTTTSAQICGENALTLNASGNGILNWYDAASGGNLIYTGTSYHTPTLTSTTTYYVESVTSSYDASQYAGKIDNTGTGQYFANQGYRYMIFDCLVPLRLVSVKVYAQGAGNRTIELRDNTGTLINSVVIDVPVTGTSGYVCTLNFDIPAGTGYRLGVATGATNTLYINANQTYPFTLANVISITNNSQGGTYYYFFYNWEVQEQITCISGRTPVTATILSLPVANAGTDQTICEGQVATLTASGGGTYAWNNGYFTAQIYVMPASTYTYTVTVTNAELCTATDSVTVNVNPLPYSNFTFSATGLNVTFTNLSVDADTYMWYFGDGGISTQPNPNYNYATDGTYAVTLIAYNSCGTDTIIQNVTVSIISVYENNTIFELIKVYPNPSQGYITVENSDLKAAIITVTDITGKHVSETNINNKINSLDLNHLSDGMYFLSVKIDDSQKTIPFIISK